MIVVLVEGAGDKRAVPILVDREHGPATVRCVDIKGKSNIVRSNRGFEDTIRRQHALGEHSFILLVDGDVTSAPYRSLEEERGDLPHRVDLQMAKDHNRSMQTFMGSIKGPQETSAPKHAWMVRAGNDNELADRKPDYKARVPLHRVWVPAE